MNNVSWENVKEEICVFKFNLFQKAVKDYASLDDGIKKSVNDQIDKLKEDHFFAMCREIRTI